MGYKALAFIRRDFRTQASYRLDFLMRTMGMLVSIGIFYFIADMLGAVVNPYLESYSADYFHFALMGIAFYPLIDLSVGSMSRLVRESQGNGTLEVLFLSPTPILAVLAMSNLWTYLWAFVQSLLYLLTATLLFHARLDWIGIPSAMVVVLVAIVANAGLGLLNASFVLVTKRSSPLVPLLSLVTGLLAGVYYPIEVLPVWLRWGARLIPATYALDALRLALLDGASVAAIGPDLLALAGLTLVLLPAGLVAFRLAVRWAKMDGSLSQY